MSTWDEGDYATLTLEVGQNGLNTEVSVTVRSPSGVAQQPNVNRDGDTDTWYCQVHLTEPGIWRASWTVEGDGQGTESYTFGVRPSAVDVPDGERLYATSADYARYIGDVPPPDTIQALYAASRDLDRLLVGARYDTDDHEMPTHPNTKRAFMQAVCAQARWAGNDGSDDDSALGAGIGQLSIGSISVTAKGGSGSSSDNSTGGGPNTVFSPAGIGYLHAAGILPIRPVVTG